MTTDLTEIMVAIRGRPYDTTNEEALQAGIAVALEESGFRFTREVVLGPRDRIDFMIGDVGIEVKVGGGQTALIRQLHRYAQSQRVGRLLVVSTDPSLYPLPATLGGVDIVTLLLDTCLF